MSSQLLLSSVVFLTFICSAIATPPTPPPPMPIREPQGLADPSLKKVSEIRWDLQENSVRGMHAKHEDGTFGLVRALDAAALKEPREAREKQLKILRLPSPTKPAEFDVWMKKFEDPSLEFNNGYASVVDKSVFTDLRMVCGRHTDMVQAEGIVIGRVKLKNYDPEALVRFLVSTGIINANIHVLATITGTHFKSDSGDWFALHSDDPYWTSRHNLDQYDFGVHVANDGTIRFHHQADVGRLPAKDAEKAAAKSN